MKIFKILAMLTISCLVFTGCENEEITNYAFQEISAPENITAAFDVSQDDSGTVTITPSGEGAQVFQVDLGNGETAELAPGESVTTVYPEGEFMVKIVAVGSTGLTSEYNQMLNISFKAPENLEIMVDQPDSNPKTITVSASADYATLFDVYFGDVEDEEPTQLMPGESIEHTYDPGIYELTVIARGAGAATTEGDEIVIIPEATDPLKLPITFDKGTVSYAAETFSGASYEVVTNPDASGANASESKVAAVTNSGTAYEGIAYTLGESVDFSGNNKTITMKVWSDVALPVLLKFEGGVNDERQTEVTANHGGTGWEELTFNFATDATKSYIDGNQGVGESFVPTGQYSGMVIFIDGPGTTAGTFYLDDIEQNAGVPFKLPITFDAFDTYTEGMITPFGGTFEVVANPDTSGDNPASSNVGSFTKGGGQYEGLTFNLDESMDFSMDNKTMSVTLWSDQAFDVLFKLETGVNGERSNEVVASHTGSGWETLTFNFATDATKSYIDGSQGVGEAFVPVGEYASLSVFFAYAEGISGTFYIDDIIRIGDAGSGEGSTGSTTTSFPVDFETAANGGAEANWSVFENADNPALEVISNPDMTGNTSSTVAKFTAKQGGQPYAGTITQLTTPFTLDASNSTVKVWVWKSVISDVGIKFENGANGSTGEIKVANTKTDEWEELTFDFSGVIGNPNNTDITGLVVFPDFDTRTQDNVVYFDNITLNPSSGDTGGGSTDTAPTTAASAPTVDASNVISLFSDAYTNVTVDTWRTDWSSVDYTETTVGGNNVKLYSNLDFVGIETVANQVDASSMTHFHVDYWTGDASVFRVKLVDFGPDEGYDGGDDTEDEIEFTVTPNTWVSLDIPLSDFTGLTNTENIAQYIFSAATAGEANVYIDNIYFHN